MIRAPRSLRALFILLVLGQVSTLAGGTTPDTAEERARLEREARQAARRARDQSRREKSAFLEAYRRMVEEKRKRRAKRERSRRVRRVDPDRNSFWRLETRARLGRDVVFTVPARSRVLVYRSTNPLQLQAFRGRKRVGLPGVRAGIPVPESRSDITGLLRSRRGHFVILVLPEKGGKPGQYELPRLRLDAKEYELINVFSDGVDILRLEVERRPQGLQAGDYFHWSVEKVLLERS